MIIERGLNPNCSEVVMYLGGIVSDKEELLRKLAEVGVFEVRIRGWYGNLFEKDDRFKKQYTSMLFDVDNPNTPDWKSHSRLWISKGGYESGGGLVIAGHQHCQWQMYPTILKIENALSVQAQGYDGGYGFEGLYTEWIEGEEKGEHEFQVYDEETKEYVTKKAPHIPNYNEEFATRRNVLLKRVMKKKNRLLGEI